MGSSRTLPEPQQGTLGPQGAQPVTHHFLCPQRSGLSEWLGDKLTPLQNVPSPAIAFILSLLVAAFTECTSNVATTTLFLPILASMVSWPCRNTTSRQPSCLPLPRDSTYGSE